jgi:hypothetical protein
VSYFYAAGVSEHAARLEQTAQGKQNADYRQMAEVLMNAVTQLMAMLRQFRNKTQDV